MSNEVFGVSIALYVKACIQYVIDSSGVVTFTCKVSAAVIGWISCCISSISQIALHVCQGGWRRCGVIACVHRSNDIASSHLCARTIRLVVEVAICMFIHFAAIGFGVHHWGLRVLGNLLCIQSVGKRAAALLYGQSAACFQGQGVACFNQLLRWCCACGVTTRSSFKAAIVDGFGNIARCGQFTCVGSSRRSNFAVVGYGQRSGRYGLSSNLIRYSFQLSNVHRIRIFCTSSHINNLTGTILRTN